MASDLSPIEDDQHRDRVWRSVGRHLEDLLAGRPHASLRALAFQILRLRKYDRRQDRQHRREERRDRLGA